MKPIYIKMSAFGSYAGEELVDFTDVASGIFLITGDTGSGKTTIFDAITYALYDETSGGKRNGEMMRSQYVDSDIRTYVEYSFIYHGKIYTIIRSPRQNRISKRRNKDGEYTMTTEQPMVTLIMPDGQEYIGKIKETNQKIIEIIGLDVNQFTQIAMIAQGEFLKLLHASSKDRKDIFTKIFNTKIYWRIEEELKERAKSIFGKLEDNRKDIIREAENVECIKDSEYLSQWEDMPSFTESDSDKQLELICLIINEAKLKEEEIRLALDSSGRELNLINIRIEQAKDINKLFASLKAAVLKKKELDIRKEEMAALKLRIDKAKKAQLVEPKEQAFLSKQKDLIECNQRISDIKSWLVDNKDNHEQLRKAKEQLEEEYKKISPGLTSRISSIRSVLPKYEELDTYNTERLALYDSNKKAEENYMKAIELISQVKKSKDQISGQQEELKAASDQYAHLKNVVDALDEKKDDLELLHASLMSMKQLRDIYEGDYKSFMEAEEAYKIKELQYDNVYHSFIEGQAGILAATLEEGSPCPVCGSISHPIKAGSSGIIVDESKLRAAKGKMDDASKLKDEKNEALQNSKRSYEKVLDLAVHEGKRIISESINSENISDIDIESILEQCKNQLKLETVKMDKAEEAKKKYSSNEAMIKSLEEALDIHEKNKEETDIERKMAADSLLKVNTRIDILKKDLVFESKAQAQEELLASEKQLQGLEEARIRTAEEYQSNVNSISEKQGKLKSEEESHKRLTADLHRTKEELSKEIISQGFMDIEDYMKAKLSSSSLEELILLEQEYRDEIIKNETAIDYYREQTKGKSIVQIDELEEKQRELADIRQQLDKDSKAVYGIRTRNEDIYDRLTRLIKDREKILKEFSNINRLADTANGKLKGRHLDFQTYIQRRYFNMVLKEANKRLYSMSNNQFILKCRDMEELSGQGEVGLDLDVYSMVNDQVRDVKTLSGGESFMAALSMALGMSDIIQNSAGSIHIDTMFIDEGFGSLSDDTRMQAIKILNDLSGGKRLVGIISHVTELKAQIGTKLVITKSERGSKARWDIQ